MSEPTCETCGGGGEVLAAISQDEFGVWDTKAHDCPTCASPTTAAPVLDVTGNPVTSAEKGSPRPCETCGEQKADGRRECGKCRIARYRSDPAKAERSRASSRRWKQNDYVNQLAAMAERQEVGKR